MPMVFWTLGSVAEDDEGGWAKAQDQVEFCISPHLSNGCGDIIGGHAHLIFERW